MVIWCHDSGGVCGDLKFQCFMQFKISRFQDLSVLGFLDFMIS